LGDPSEKDESDYEFHVSIFQKFIDSAIVDFIIEVLEDDLDDVASYNFSALPKTPKCSNVCLTGG
jgi:hypothetical protein